MVEDDLIVSRMHKFSLGGYVNNDPKVCVNGRDAIDHLDKVANEKEKILIFLDLNMPVMNGWEFLEICHSRVYREKLHVVVITSSSYKDDKEKVLSYEQVKAYYTKPLKREYLNEIFQQPEIAKLNSAKN